MEMRLQKFLAEAGVASRRASEKLIAEGAVSVNGQVWTELGKKVDPGRDQIAVHGQPVKIKRKVYLAVNKPPGCICTRSDPEGRSCVGDLLPKEMRALHSVGRLDFKSEGLIFFTNDGEFSLRLTHPRYGVRKKYRVVVSGKVEGSALHPLTKGVYDEGELLRAERVRILEANNTGSVLEIELSEGKNREVRRMLEKLGLEVERLQRVQIGPIKLGELPKGKWRTLSETEVRSLLAASASPNQAVPAPLRPKSKGPSQRVQKWRTAGNR